MGVNTIEPRRNLQTVTSRSPSPAIWADCPWDDLVDPRSTTDGVAFFDDFDRVPLPPTLTTQIAYPPYKAYATSGDTIGPVSAINSVGKAGGFLRFLHNTDNNSCSLAMAGQPFWLNGLTTTGKLWFECRLAVNSILTNMQGIFVGLAETGQLTLAATVPLSALDVPSNGGAMIGFHTGEDALGVWDAVVADRAVTFTNIQASVGTFSAAYTFMKLGFVYDPNVNPGAQCIRFFVDNLLTSTQYSQSSLVANTYLDALPLGLLFGSVSDSVATGEVYLDWWRCAQIIP